MKTLAPSLVSLVLLAGCTPSGDEQVIDQLENAVRTELAAQGEVRQVELNKDNDDRITGYALVEPREAPGTERRYTCSAERDGDTGSRFNWRCTPPVQQAAAGASAPVPSGGKDPSAAVQPVGVTSGPGPGPGRMALVGRWTDNGDCTTVTLLGEDGVFIAADGTRGNWDIQGSQLVLSVPGQSVSVPISLPDPNTLVLTSADGTTSQSTRC